MRPHERRAALAQSTVSLEDDPFGHITPPTLETLEAVEKAFPAVIPSGGSGVDGFVDSFALMNRIQGQQEVVQFLRNLVNTARGE